LAQSVGNFFKSKHLQLTLRALPDKAFSKKCTKCRLAAGLRPDQLAELTALPQTP